MNKLNVRVRRFIDGAAGDAWIYLTVADRRQTARQRVRAAVAIGLAGSAVGWMASGVAFGLICGIGLPIAARGVVRLRGTRRRSAIDAAAADLATVVANAIRSGLSVQRALALAVERTDGPLRDELRTLALDLRMGVALTTALTGLRDRADSERVAMVVAAIELQRRAGGDLAELLQRFADGFRARSDAEQGAKSATAQARFTGWIVIALPLGVMAMVELAHPGFLLVAAASPVALVLLGAGAALHLAGSLAILRIARVRS